MRVFIGRAANEKVRSFVIILGEPSMSEVSSPSSAKWRLFKGQLIYLRKALKAVRGGDPGECPLCGYVGRFINSGNPPLPGIKCPSCTAGPRHRLLKLIQDREGIIPAGSEILHFAAERATRRMVAATRPGRYVTADLEPGFDLQVDIENLAVADASFDVVICSHVLEHVNDKLALASIHRVLRPGGRLVAMVPIVDGWSSTYENPAITSRSDRKRHFGSGNHVRYYGRDFPDRLAAAGFTVRDYTGTPEDVIRYRLNRGERVFVGTR
jgi:SAM-dependent methyltransferase